jgi:hypothetical protein
MRSKRQDCVEARIWGMVPTDVLLKVSKNFILKWKKFGTIKILPRAGHPAKMSNRVEKGFGQGGDQESDGHSDRAPEFLCGDGITFQKDNHQCSTPPIRPLW